MAWLIAHGPRLRKFARTEAMQYLPEEALAAIAAGQAAAADAGADAEGWFEDLPEDAPEADGETET